MLLPDMTPDAPAGAPTTPTAPAHDWSASFADRAARVHLTVVSGPTYPPHANPNFISLRSGAPPPECVPFEWLESGSARVWSRDATIFGYGPARGDAPLRAAVAALMRERGCTDVTPEHITLLTGAQQGLDILARLLLNPGDAIATDEPAYPGAMQIFDLHRPRYLPVPVTAAGPNLDVLAAMLAGGARPKFLYTVPTFQNPTGATLPRAGRERLVALCRRHALPVIEDDPYGELRFRGEAVPPLRALDADVLYLGTFSKTIAPGIRVGWLVAPPALWEKLYALKEAMDINSDRVMQGIVAAALATGYYPGHVVRVRAVYRERCDRMLAALRQYMPPDVTWDEPEGGFFVWVRLPAGVDVGAVEAAGRAIGVGIVPGTGCSVVPGGGADTLRLSYCAVPVEQITEGVRRVAAAIAGVREQSLPPDGGRGPHRG